jgi:hypothetical protein
VEAARRGMDATGLTAAEYELVRSFLLRRDSLDPEARARLAEELRTRLRERVGTADPDASAEAFLEAVAASYRERFGP